MKSNMILRDPEVLGGAPVFRGTRVPVATLFDYLEAGDSIDDFLAGFPTVKREQVIRYLEAIRKQTCAPAWHLAGRVHRPSPGA